MATTVQNPFDTQPPSAGGTTPMNVGAAPANAEYQQYNPTAGVKPLIYQAGTSQVHAPTETAAGQVDSILAQDSPLMQRARTLATQQMAQRGLVNSSMTAGAGVAAMIDRATPIAQQDAQTYSNRAMFNTDALNQSNQFNAAQANDLYKFGQDIASRYGLQFEGQKFQAGENALQRQFQSGENALDRGLQTTLQSNQFGFQGAQNALDRSLQTTLQSNQFGFQGAQAALDRAQQTSLQQSQFNFQSAQSELDRALQKYQVDKSIESQKELQISQQNFAAAQSDLDRAQQTALQEGQFGFQAGQNSLQLAFNERMAQLQESGNDFRQAREIASREAITQLEQMGITNRFDQELALKSDMFNVEQINADRRTVEQNAFELQKLGIQLNAQRQDIPSQFAANLSVTTMNGVNAIMADSNLSAAPDGYINPQTGAYTQSSTVPTGMTPSSPKTRAISNLQTYANSQLAWAAQFYGTSIPSFQMPGDKAQAYLANNPDVAAAYAQNSYGMTAAEYAAHHYNVFGQAEGRTF